MNRSQYNKFKRGGLDLADIDAISQNKTGDQAALLEEYGITITNKLGSWQGVDLATGAVWGTFPSLNSCIDSILASKKQTRDNNI